MSFDINEAVFDSKGTYLEEKAVRYNDDHGRSGGSHL
jgi:hypothetical protein